MLLKVHVHCHNCGGQADPADCTPVGPHLRFCRRCRETHEQAIAVLLDKGPPQECARCQRTWDDLKRQLPGDEVRMQLILLNGLYLLLCPFCDAHFRERSKHRYRETPFGKRMNLE